MKQVLSVSKKLRADEAKHSRALASGGSPAVITRKIFKASGFLYGARSKWKEAYEDLQGAFEPWLAAQIGLTPPAGIRPYEIDEQVQKAVILYRAGAAVLFLECLIAICIGVLSWDLPWPIAAAFAVALTVVLSMIAAVFVHILADRDAKDDPHQALRRIDAIALASVAIWGTSLLLALVASRVSSTGAALLVLFHGSLIVMTVATPILATAIWSKAALYNGSRRFTQVYNHLIETRDRLDMLELEVRRIVGELGSSFRPSPSRNEVALPPGTRRRPNSREGGQFR